MLYQYQKKTQIFWTDFELLIAVVTVGVTWLPKARYAV